LPSRRCGGVEFAILCTLPTSHQPHPRDCDALMPFVCGATRGAIQPLPWENPLGPDSNFLVIAELSVTGHALTATVGARRTLWPVALMQEWIASCLCPLIDKPDKPPVILPGHVDSPPPPPGGHIEEIKPPDAFIVQPPPVQAPDIGVNKAAESNLKLAIDPQPSPQNAAPDLRAQLTGPVTDIAGVGPARAQQLAAIGVVTAGDFMSAAPDQLAKTMNLAADKIAEMKQDVSTRNNLKPAVG
jgi:predicted flap endonuclease-1-like 5' DNA nuclease